MRATCTDEFHASTLQPAPSSSPQTDLRLGCIAFTVDSVAHLPQPPHRTFCDEIRAKQRFKESHLDVWL
ncbi:hypothetical protein Mapa_000506 [Marchantia paleacea]|nr:hypothetical protein Mapa_000506 [Marchantia paleacea]